MKTLILLILLIPSISFAKNITFQWSYTYSDASPVSGVYYDENGYTVTGFKLYEKTKGGSYGTAVATAAAGETELTYDCDDPSRFVLRAYNSEYESVDSNEVTNFRRNHGGAIFFGN